MTVDTIVGLFNIFVGAMLVGAFLFMGGGLIVWWIRLGTWPTYRDEAIEYMQWGVAMLFTLVLLLGIAKSVQEHTREVLLLLGAIGAIAVAYALVWAFAGGEPEKKEEHGRGADRR